MSRGKGALLALMLPMLAPVLLILVMGMGNASIEAVESARCSVPSRDTTGESSVGVGTLNWRGASQYELAPHPKESPYSDRVPHMIAKLNESGVTVAGFQEFEPPQASAFLEQTGGRWALVEGKDSKGQPSTNNAVAYVASEWRVDETRYVKVPHGDTHLQVPLVRLVSSNGLRSVWVLNTHHPARGDGGTKGTRDAAVRAEVTALEQVHASDPSTPRLVTGSMGDSDRFLRLFSSLAPGWTSAVPGTESSDWIMASPGVTFSNTVVDTSTDDHARRYTDHPFVHTSIGFAAKAGALPTAAGPVGAFQGGGCAPCPSLTTQFLLQPASGVGGLETAKTAATAAFQAGFRGEDLVMAVAIARVESTWNPRAVNGTHYGLWQISEQHKGKVAGWTKPDDIFDPVVNAKYAFSLYSARSGSGEAKFADWIPFQKTSYRLFMSTARQAVAEAGGGAVQAGCSPELGGVSGDRLNRLRQRAATVIALSQRYASPCLVPGFDCQGVNFSGWSNACTAISMMIYGHGYVGPGDGGERAYGSVVQGQQGSSWPPPPGAIVSWPYAGSGHVAIYLGGGDWVDNWPEVGHHSHSQIEKGVRAHWLLPPATFEGSFLNNGAGH